MKIKNYLAWKIGIGGAAALMLSLANSRAQHKAKTSPLVAAEPESPAPVPVDVTRDSTNRGHFTFDGGVAFQQDVKLHDQEVSKASFDPGLRLDLEIGGRFNESWGMGLDLGLIYNAMRPVPNPFTVESEGLDIFQIPLIFSLTYRLPLHGPLDVYVGVGLGPVLGIYSGGGTSIVGISSDWAFGYQG